MEGLLQSFMMLIEKRSISFMIDKTRLRGRAADVTPLKPFVMFSQLFVTGPQKLSHYQKVNIDRNQFRSSDNK